MFSSTIVCDTHHKTNASNRHTTSGPLRACREPLCGFRPSAFYQHLLIYDCREISSRAFLLTCHALSVPQSGVFSKAPKSPQSAWPPSSMSAASVCRWTASIFSRYSTSPQLLPLGRLRPPHTWAAPTSLIIRSSSGRTIVIETT